MSNTKENPLKIENGISYDENGWKYISVKGTPKQRGYAHGYFAAKDFKEIQKTMEYNVMEEYGLDWQEFFIKKSATIYNDKIKETFPEFYEEMEGIVEGVNANKEVGATTDIDEIIAWNNSIALLEYWYPHQNDDADPKKMIKGEGGGRRRPGGTDRCSAFVANGDYTKDGKIVMAHNSFCPFLDGQYYNYIVDIQCEDKEKDPKSFRILMQTCPCWIWSGSDFFITSAGIMGTETTIGGFGDFENNLPISCRIREAMQYGATLDDYERILLKGNSGDYANSWLFGDTNTNEIMVIELGLKFYKTEKKTNGYFFGCNVAFDPKIRNLECGDTGYCDIRRHQGSRQVRIPDMVEEYKGKLDVESAKIIIADHYDVYLKKENPCSRTICSHYELDAREYMSDPSRPKPFQPRGAVDGAVVDTEMTKNMSFAMRWGSSCGTAFDKAAFCDEHRQWKMMEPYLRDRPSQPWTDFSVAKDSDMEKGEEKEEKETEKEEETKKEEKDDDGDDDDDADADSKKKIIGNHRRGFK